MRTLLTVLLVLGIFVIPEPVAKSDTITEILGISSDQVHFVKELPSDLVGRVAETDGHDIWIDTDNVTDIFETLAHEVSHINAWTPNDWHGEEWEREFERVMGVLEISFEGSSSFVSVAPMPWLLPSVVATLQSARSLSTPTGFPSLRSVTAPYHAL